MENQELELKQEAVQLKNEIVSCPAIKTQEQYNKAADMLNRVKGKIKKINDWFEPLVKAAHAAHMALKDRQNEILKPAVEAESTLKYEMQNYIMGQDQKQKEIQDKLNTEAEAKRKALEERARLAAEAGKDAKSEALLEKAQEIIAPIVAPSVQSVKTETGMTSIRRDTQVIVINKMALLREIIAGAIRVPETVVDINESKLKAWVKATNINECPGLVIKKDVPIPVSRAKS
jgi:hypothetical protein